MSQRDDIAAWQYIQRVRIYHFSFMAVSASQFFLHEWRPVRRADSLLSANGRKADFGLQAVCATHPVNRAFTLRLAPGIPLLLSGSYSQYTSVIFTASFFLQPVHFTMYALFKRTCPGVMRKYFLGASSIKSSRSIHSSQ